MSGPEEGQICTGLFSRGTAPLLGFDFAIEWQTNEFRFDAIILGDNPLGLVPEEIFSAPDRLAFRRDTLARDTTPPLPYGTKLFDLCFEPLVLRGSSCLSIGRDSTPSFQVLREDSTVVNAPYRLLSGALYLPDEELSDTIRLSAAASTFPSPSDTVTCATILADNFVNVSAFDFLLRWPSRLRLNSISYPGTPLGLDEGNLRNVSTNFARFAYVPDSLVNVTLPPGTPLLELCFAGEVSPCDFVQIELDQQPASTYFDRQLFNFTEGAPLPFALSSGYLTPFVQDTLELELEFAVSDPDNRLHEVRLSTSTARCFSSYSFRLSYDPQDLNYLGEQLVEARLDNEHILERYSSIGSGIIPFAVKTEIPGRSSFFPAGDIAAFRLVRRSGSDRDTVPLLLSPDGPNFAKVFTPDGDSVLLPVILRSGGLIFRQDSTTAARQVPTPDLSPLNVYPNPTNGEVNLEGLPNTLPVTVWLYDQLGRVRWHQRRFTPDFILPALPTGVYWLRTEQGDNTWVNALQVR